MVIPLPLIDCDIIRYCLDSEEERQAIIQKAELSQLKPVYVLPVFELCRALHVLVKFYGVQPSFFRNCWAEYSESFYNSWEESYLHINTHELGDYLLGLQSPASRVLEEGEHPCEDDAERYWDRHIHLIQRSRRLHPKQSLKNGWMAEPPEGRRMPAEIVSKLDSGDILLDTNNFLEVLNSLPVEGMIMNREDLRLPARLSERAQRRIREIVETRGVAGHFIIPFCVLEEAEWVANRTENQRRYQQARQVLYSISMNPDLPLWNIFSFEPLSQEIFDLFLELYDRLMPEFNANQGRAEFGDLLVIAHGLYHGCPIASNEWFEGEPDVWQIVAGMFPFLVVLN